MGDWTVIALDALATLTGLDPALIVSLAGQGVLAVLAVVARFRKEVRRKQAASVAAQPQIVQRMYAHLEKSLSRANAEGVARQRARLLAAGQTIEQIEAVIRGHRD